MKLRSTLLLLVSMLLVGSLAAAAMTDGPAAPAAPAPAVVASPVVASPLCLANTSQAKLPAINLNPVVEKSAQLCGACSDIRCANNTLGALCQTGKRCYNLYGNVCSQDGLNQCTCYSGPLP